MPDRSRPPDDISPTEFFLNWAPREVGEDGKRRGRLAGLDSTIQFVIQGEGGGSYFLRIANGQLEGFVGTAEDPDLALELDLATWRQLNSGELKAPQAVLKRRLRFKGRLDLALKLHLIIG